ncbi:polysaccharide pyruvyl transferase family protein [Lactococcus insecticola]|uniref:Polysaccharide pyruvyl transferase domain-containing protein n=1 Tax=Pseudolactococcus insecticola TaxID=2709158 RepID=A0A6A0B8G9_9LACT|nr:polysaccharide pyruvyl transferase family protein [Lactococcus insecticola]GFH40953.1 hypothetical protein Hs20B_13510 [Lactococcus insecticola]
MNQEIIYLVAHSGAPNYGDELIPKLWLDFLTAKYPDKTIIVDTLRPGLATSFWGFQYRNVHFVDTLFQLVERLNNLGVDFTKADEQVEKFLTQKLPKLDFGIDLLLSAQSIHFVGGGYINGISRSFRGQFKLFLLANAAKKINPSIKLFATGLGLTPIPEQFVGKLNDVIIPNFDVFEVRDEETAASLPNATLGFDDMFLGFSDVMREKKTIAYDLDKPKINILLQRHLQGRDEIEATLTPIFDYLKTRDDFNETTPINVVESISPDDGWLAGAIKRYTPNPIVFTTAKDLLWNGFPAAPDSIWFTTRFHFHMIAAANGFAGTFINTGGAYYDVKHGSLAKLGTGWRNYAESGDMTPEVSATFSETAQKLGNLKYQLAEKIYL